MGKGTLAVQLSTADGAMPVIGAEIQILDARGNLLHTLSTNENGRTEQVELPAPPKETQLDPAQPERPYARYTAIITAQGFRTVAINGLQIFDAADSTLPISMTPGNPSDIDEYEIGKSALEMEAQSGAEFAPPTLPTARIHREVFIPTHITVHLGVPASNARNVTLPFVDYLKNAAYTKRRTV